MRTQKDIEKLVDYYKAKLEEHGRVFKKPILTEVFKRKTYRTYGKAYIYHNKPYSKVVINQWIKHDHDLVNTILHELSHLDSEAIGAGHGPKWKRVASIYGRLFNTDITRTSIKELLIKRDRIQTTFVYTEKALRETRIKGKVLNHSFVNENKLKDYVSFVSSKGYLEKYEVLPKN